MYHETEGNPRFHVGDYVRVVDNPFWGCPFGWVGGMTLLCGKEVKITQAWWNYISKTYVYGVDHSGYAWCANCFNEIADTIHEQTESGFLEDFRNLFS